VLSGFIQLIFQAVIFTLKLIRPVFSVSIQFFLVFLGLRELLVGNQKSSIVVLKLLYGARKLFVAELGVQTVRLRQSSCPRKRQTPFRDVRDRDITLRS
jgi:hypothetical protein